MKTRRIVGWVIMIIPFVFWLTSIAGASNAGFFADPFDYSIMVMGGAISVNAAATLFKDW